MTAEKERLKEIKVPVHNLNGEIVGEMTLNPKVWGEEIRPDLLHEAVTMHLANGRVGTHSTKTRAEVRGGGRKPWPQKHTGRARQGSIRAPHWRHGGVAHGPKPRDYSYAMPKKKRRKAIRVALSSRVATGNLIVVENMDLGIDKPKTKRMIEVLRNLGVLNDKGKKGRTTTLIAVPKVDLIVKKSASNIPGVSTIEARNLNVYDILKHKVLIMTVDAVKVAEEVFAP